MLDGGGAAAQHDPAAEAGRRQRRRRRRQRSARGSGGGLVTPHCWLVGVCGCLSGISYGYDTPVVSGLLVQAEFLGVLGVAAHQGPSGSEGKLPGAYCRLNAARVQLFVAAPFFASALATCCALACVDRCGRRALLLAGAALTALAVALQAAAPGAGLLTAGRVVLGLGQGFSVYVAPMYACECAPAAVRGRFGAAYSLASSCGQLLAFAANQALHGAALAQSWRVSLAGAAWCPLLMLALLAAVLPDTPSSLLQRGHTAAARRAFDLLRRAGGPERELEWQRMLDEAGEGGAAAPLPPLPPPGAAGKDSSATPPAMELAAVAAADGLPCTPGGDQRRRQGGGGLRLGAPAAPAAGRLRSVARRYLGMWPALVIMLHLTVVRCFNGFLSIMFFTAALFSATGASTRTSLLAQTLMGVCTVVGGLLALAGIDKLGRRPLLVWFGLCMAGLMAAAAAVLATGLPPAAAAAGERLGTGATAALMALLCCWQVCHWASWGPAYYPLMSELHPLANRARAVGVGVSIFNLSVASAVLLGPTLLCRLAWGALVLHAGVCAWLALFAAAALPEFKGTSLQDASAAFAGHWLWRRFVSL